MVLKYSQGRVSRSELRFAMNVADPETAVWPARNVIVRAMADGSHPSHVTGHATASNSAAS